MLLFNVDCLKIVGFNELGASVCRKTLSNSYFWEANCHYKSTMRYIGVLINPSEINRGLIIHQLQSKGQDKLELHISYCGSIILGPITC